MAERIQDDPILSEVICRGIVNQRALARWMIETYDWDESEDSVLSGIRRYGPEEHPESLSRARKLLAKSHVNTRSSVCSVTLTGVAPTQDGLSGLLDEVQIERGDVVRLLSSDRGLKVILDERNADLVPDVFPEDAVGEIRRDLTEIAVVLPPEGWEVPGILCTLARPLSLRQINIAGIVDGVRQVIFLVDGEDAVEAFQALEKTLDAIPESPPEAGPTPG